MALFGKVIRTAINTVVLPAAVAKDIFTLGGIARYPRGSYTVEQLKRIKDEAED